MSLRSASTPVQNAKPALMQRTKRRNDLIRFHGDGSHKIPVVLEAAHLQLGASEDGVGGKAGGSKRVEGHNVEEHLLAKPAERHHMC